MADKDSLDPAGKGDGQREGRSDQESERTVPVAVVEKMREDFRSTTTALQQQVARLEGMAEANQRPAQRQEEPKFTRAQLKAQVDEGKISESEMDEILERQLKAEVLAEARKTVKDETATMTTAQKVKGQISRYMELEPDINVPGTAIQKRADAEFNALVELGDDPKSQTTTLKALRAVLGPVEDLERAKSARGERETYEGGSGAGGDDSGGGSNKDGSPANLTPRERAFYTKQIDRGIYKDWDAVKEELKHSNPALRRKHGASKDLRLN